MRETTIISEPGLSGTSADLDTVGLEDVVETVREFGVASIELVAWELSLPTSSIDPSWTRAVERRLITEVGSDPGTGESMFTLAA
jgi:hypothetical protein